MLLTKQMLNNILRNYKVQIPAELKKQLLGDYGNLVVDEEGHVFEYTEQDICEQLRKIIRPFQGPGELPDDVALAFRQMKQ
jgi:hypothetical protein